MVKEAFNNKENLFFISMDPEMREALVKCCVWSVLLSGCKTWTLGRCFEMRMILRKIKRKNGLAEGMMRKF